MDFERKMKFVPFIGNYLWQRRVTFGNLAVFPALVGFLDENDRNELSAGTQSNSTQHLENPSEQFCRAKHS
jgi:hypothetical protein